MKLPSEYIEEEERNKALEGEAEKSKAIAEQERLRRLAEMALRYSTSLQQVEVKK